MIYVIVNRVIFEEVVMIGLGCFFGVRFRWDMYVVIYKEGRE